MSTDTSILAREWVHSHEEDAQQGGGALVFRPADFRFPPSRGRWRLDLRADHTASEVTPGAADQGAIRTRSWSVNNQNQLVLSPLAADRHSTVMDILEASPDRLVVGRPGTS